MTMSATRPPLQFLPLTLRVIAALGKDAIALKTCANETRSKQRSCFADGEKSGAAYVFVRNGTNWSQQAFLKAFNPWIADGFGFSTAVSGDTVVVGALGQSVPISTAGAKGKRFSLPHARVLIHQPSLGGLSGQATDIAIQAREILRMREITNNILVRHTGQPIEKIEKDVERDYIMIAEQAKEYGVVDQIIHKHV